ncbi:hypothetical protein EMIT0P12_10172 [Pseudomonas sp. IT-P12]
MSHSYEDTCTQTLRISDVRAQSITIKSVPAKPDFLQFYPLDNMNSASTSGIFMEELTDHLG